MEHKVISVIGYMDVDLFMKTERMPDPGECLQAQSYSAGPGGKGANAAMAAFRGCHIKVEEVDEPGRYHFETSLPEIDIEVRMIGRVGDDPYGIVAKENLKENGINVDGVDILPGELTGVCFALIDKFTGENRLIFTTGATDRLGPEDFLTPESLGNGVRPDLVISQLEVRREAVEQILLSAKAAGIDVLLNAAPAQAILPELYECITHLIVNETEAAMLSVRELEDVNEETWSEIADEFLMEGAKNVVITLGSRGAYYANAHDKGHAPAVVVEVEDVTGAGYVIDSIVITRG